MEGEVAKPQVIDIDTLIKWFPLEERVYRMRCVEAWSMVIPWSGFPLGQLIKKLDTANDKYADKKMGSFVVFLNNDSEELTGKLKEVAEKQHLKHTILALDNQAGPKNYNVAQEADVTVVLYTDHKVKANYAFKKGELKDADIEKIVGDVSKIVKK